MLDCSELRLLNCKSSRSRAIDPKTMQNHTREWRGQKSRDLEQLQELIPAQFPICRAGGASPLCRRQKLSGCIKDVQSIPVAGGGGPLGHDVHPLLSPTIQLLVSLEPLDT